MLEEEIDIRPYIQAVVQKWKVVVITAVVGLIIGVIFSMINDTTYLSTTLISVRQTQDIIAVDNAIRENAESQPLNAFPELALSDEVIAETLEALQLSETFTINQFRSQLRAQSGSHNSIIRLEVTSADPEKSAQYANVWAATFVDWANESFGGQNEQRAQFFELQRQDAQLALQTAQSNLIEFESINSTTTISNTLAAHNQTYLNYIEQDLRLQQISNDVALLKQHLESQPDALDVTLADQLVFTLFQLSTFNGDEYLSFAAEFTLQESQLLSSSDIDEQLLLLDNLFQTVTIKRSQIQEELTDLESIILSLQQESQALFAEKTQLQNDIQIASATLSAIVFEIAEERLTVQTGNEEFQIASYAVAPQANSGLNQLIIISLATALGAFLAIFYLVVRTWWEKSDL